MKKIVDISRCAQRELGFLRSSEHIEMSTHSKGWSYSFVYNFLEIRNVFLLLRKSGQSNIKGLFKAAISSNLPFVKSEWQERRLLEHVNALINFGLIDRGWKLKEEGFLDCDFSDPLRSTDMELFMKIFYEYFRFKEIALWFSGPHSKNLAPMIEELDVRQLRVDSNPIFFTANLSRFMDTIFYSLDSPEEVFTIEKGLFEDQKRFWDVFLIWGVNLGVLEKISLQYNGYQTDKGKNITLVFFINENPPEVNIIEFIRSSFNSRQVEVPELLLKICIEFRISLNDAQDWVISAYKSNKQVISIERTSEIFIKRGEIKNEERFPYLKIEDSYISHLIIRT